MIPRAWRAESAVEAAAGVGRAGGRDGVACGAGKTSREGCAVKGLGGDCRDGRRICRDLVDLRTDGLRDPWHDKYQRRATARPASCACVGNAEITLEDIGSRLRGGGRSCGRE